MKIRFWRMGELVGKEAEGSVGQVLKGKLLHTDQRKTERRGVMGKPRWDMPFEPESLAHRRM